MRSTILFNVEVAQNVVETAIVWQAIEQRPDGFFRGHGGPSKARPVIRSAG
jgi:hypothetical protein